MKTCLRLCILCTVVLAVACPWAQNAVEECKADVVVSSQTSDGLFKVLTVNRIMREKYLRPRRKNFLNTFVGTNLHEDSGLLPYDSRGEYFYVVWRYTGKEDIIGPVTLRFEYKRKNQTDSVVFTKTYEELSKGKYKEIVENYGDNFYKGGKVVWWKVSLVRGEEVLERKISALAHALEKK